MTDDAIDPLWQTSSRHRRRPAPGWPIACSAPMAEAEDAVQDALPALARRRSRSAIARAARVPDARRSTRLCLDVLKSARRAPRAVRRAVAAGSGHRHRGAGARRADRARRGSVGRRCCWRSNACRRSSARRSCSTTCSTTRLRRTWPTALGRNEAACRQLASRARTRVREARPAGPVATRAGGSAIRSEARREIVSAFLTASRSGDLATLTSLLASDAAPRDRQRRQGCRRRSTCSKVPTAWRRSWPASSGRAGPTNWTVRFDTINGLPGLVLSGPTGLGPDHRVRARRRRGQGDLRGAESRQTETSRLTGSSHCRCTPFAMMPPCLQRRSRSASPSSSSDSPATA